LIFYIIHFNFRNVSDGKEVDLRSEKGFAATGAKLRLLPLIFSARSNAFPAFAWHFARNLWSGMLRLM
jgi:hypothetical protein